MFTELTYFEGKRIGKYSRTLVKDHLGQETTLLLRPLEAWTWSHHYRLGIKTTLLLRPLLLTPKGGLYIKVRL